MSAYALPDARRRVGQYRGTFVARILIMQPSMEAPG